MPTHAGIFDFAVRIENRYGYRISNLSLTIERRLTLITLPNRRLTNAERDEWIADYIYWGGPTMVELEVIDLINIERANYDLAPVQLDERLMMAARFFTQQHNDLGGHYPGLPPNWGHNFGPYATNPEAQSGASRNVAAAFGAHEAGISACGHSNGTGPASQLVAGWMNSPPHRAIILIPNQRFIGVGQFPGGISYMFLNHSPSDGTQEITMIFDANGGTGIMQPQTFVNGIAEYLHNNTFTKEGYTFIGWRIIQAGTAVQFTDGENIIVRDHHIIGQNVVTLGRRTLYAVWKRTPMPLTINFSANGGTGIVQPQTFHVNEAQYLHHNAFTKEGYTFQGWNPSPMFSFVLFTDGERFVISENTTESITLYAVWVRN